jgi:hypothetical protein
MQTRYFVYLEFTDPNVCKFLDDLRSSLSIARFNDSPHITVRGPYTTKPETEALEEWRHGLHGQGVFLIDPGVFKTPKGFAVYLHAKSSVFDKIWWKPDYRGPKSSRKPHVTLFETKSAYAAGVVKSFLETEEISIFTYAIDLTVHTSKQHQLLGSNHQYLDHSYVALPQERIVIREGLLERATNIRNHISEYEGKPPFQPLLI